MKTAYRVIKIVFSSLIALAMVILSVAEAKQKDNYYEPVSVQTFALADALFRAQGVTTDGSHYYFSSNFGLIKTQLDAETVVEQRLVVIPAELLKLGCKHIGGISYYDGKIFAPIEDSKVFENLYIAAFDADTLELLYYKALPLEQHEKGVPWCVADKEQGYIYSAGRDHITKINVYDADTLELVKVIELEESVHKVQGGEMYDGILYLSVSREEQAVFAVNLATGQVQKAFARNLVDDCEGEGMTIVPTPDGALFHVMDVASARIGTHLRHYAFDPNTLIWK